MKKWLAAILLVILVGLDQFTKYLAATFLQGKNPVVLIKNVLEFCYLEGGNTGAAFGLFQGKTLALGILSLILFILLIVVFIKISEKPDTFLLSLSIIVMASGALGNCIDRIFRHAVIDFIYFKWIDFPIFNLADCYVTVSAVALFLLVAFSKDNEKDAAEE